MNIFPQLPTHVVASYVALALNEDLSFFTDYTALLVDPDLIVTATIITREPATLCGTDFATLTFKLCDKNVIIKWHVKDGDTIHANQILCEITGLAHKIVTAERTALNFLQTLSATATTTALYVQLIKDTKTKITDNRKTIPLLRLAQKYAVRVGGGKNHRMGLYDGVLIKENHIISAGGVKNVLEKAFQITPPNIPIQIEVETFEQLTVALECGAKFILLDNMDINTIKKCVSYNNGRSILEVSGGVNSTNILEFAKTGVDRISIGAITKHITAIDMSLLIN